MLYCDMTCYDMYDNEKFSNAQLLSYVMNDKRMKIYACMLRRVIGGGGVVSHE